MTTASNVPPPDSPALKFFGFSPWLLVCLSCILASAIIFLALRNTDREREKITQNFLDRADALIWALEAATRTGMEFGEERKLLQPFIRETARQRGIVYIAVVDADGRILAHSDPREVGKILPQNQLPSAEPPRLISWHTPHSSDSSVYEVYREFAPTPGYHHGFSGEHGDRHDHQDRAEDDCGMDSGRREPAPRSFALIGFDKTPYEEMFARDRSSNVMTACVAAMLGLGSFFSLFWAHSYRRSRRLLKDTRALASEVVTSLPVGLITSDPGGTVRMMNETALTMLRTGKARTVGASIHDIQGLDWSMLIAALARNKKIIEREMELALQGESATISLSASQIRDEDGLFLGHLFILRDISAMKRLQAEAQRNDKLRALGSLAAGVAHEIRNPLSSIKGLATYLAKRMTSAEAEAEAAKTLITEVDRLNRVVSQLLEFARPGAIKLADTDVNAVIDRALRLADADIRAKNIHVAFSKNDALPRIPLNEERFTQALLNLFLNAIQAMESGGNLAIDVSMPEGGGICRVSVKDDGPGMPQEILTSIFTPYFTTKTSGTGLGLSIVHQIIEGHGGSVAVKSEPGRGSVFSLLLPAGKRRKEAL